MDGGSMLRFFSLFIFGISCCSATNTSSSSHVPDFWLPRVANLRGNPAQSDGLDGSLAQIFGRGISQDPSCPNGFLCVQQACPANVFCPAGQTCINFEGTIACGIPGLEICALNPNTLEAVGCSDGTCCHGNCYTKNAVCCNFPSIQCDVGDLCNACNPGQTCGNNQCTGPGPSTTSKTSISSITTPPPPPPPPSTSKVSTTSSSSTTSSRSTTSVSSTISTISTTSTAPTPTVVASIGNFKNIGCFDDSTTARVLVAGERVDQSSTGMTVEECVAFALSGDFQYAGVEFGGECFVGNTLHGASSAAQGDCNEVCAGDTKELCGAGNRIQIYQDSTWFNPTTTDLANFLQEYTQSLTQAQAAIASYRADIQALQNALANPSRARSLTETQVEIEMQILGDTRTLQLVESIIAQAEANGGRLFLIAASDDIPQPTVNGAQLSEVQNLLGSASRAVSDTASIATDDSASIAESIAESTAPLIDLAEDVSVSAGAIETLGLPAIGAVAATGLFFIIFGLFKFFSSGGNSGGGDPSSIACTTITAQDCAVGCSVTNFGDTSFATNCFTTSCTNTIGCLVEASTTTTATTTSLCPLSTPQGTIWIPASGIPLPFLGNNNVWTTPAVTGV